MQESVIYQDIKAEGIQEGIQQGIQEGIQQGIQERICQEQQLVLRLLTRKVGDLPEDYRHRVEQLQPAQLEALIEALLDFEQRDHLEHWLAAQAQRSEEPETP
ncbi:MAG: DUF4351 domain-containing protein [Cyanothece sp. SIO1E1]|nr:DUF4351 domain-containing protein [Cyanothece sp. SIO1E1]